MVILGLSAYLVEAYILRKMQKSGSFQADRTAGPRTTAFQNRHIYAPKLSISYYSSQKQLSIAEFTVENVVISE